MPPATTAPKDQPAEKPAASAAEKPTTEKPAAEKPRTKTQVEGIQAFLSKHLPGSKFVPPGTPKTPEPKKEEEDETAAGEETPPKATATKKKPAPFKPKATPQPKPEAPAALSAEQIAEAAARGTAKAMSEAKPATKEQDKKSPEDGLPPQEQRKVETLRRMEQLQPEKYKGLADKYLRSITAVEDYAQAWEKAHPGQEFDEASPEHEDFFKKNDVDWQDDDYADARADMVVEKRLQGAEEKTKAKVEELERKLTLQESIGQIKAKRDAAAVDFWSKMGDAYKGFISEQGVVSAEKAAELQKANPDGFALSVQTAETLEAEAAELYKLFNGLVENDPVKNPRHKVINDFALAMEKDIMAKPIQERKDDEGRDFVPAGKYARMTKAEKEGAWTFSMDDLLALRTHQLATYVQRRTKEMEASHRAWAKAHGIELPDESTGKTTEGEEPTPPARGKGPPGSTAREHAEEEEELEEKPRSPSSAPGSRQAAVRSGAGTPDSATGRSSFIRNFLK